MPRSPVRLHRPLAPRPSRRRLAVLAALVALGGLYGRAPTLAHAAPQTVTTCDKIHLDAAIAAASGDTITFACSGTITDNLIISKNLTLDATGQHVTIDGGSTSANPSPGRVIFVGQGTHLTLIALTLTHGNAGNGPGGGISNSGGTVTLTNSTVSGNSATAGLEGGGIVNFNGGTVTLTNSTVSDNSALFGGGGIFNVGGAVTLRNTILAGNSASTGPDCVGTLTSGGYNLLGNDSGCVFTPATGDQVGTAASPIDPTLGPLQDNGGPTYTQALLAGSPAIDVVSQAHLAGLTTDQRGLPRPNNGETVGDIGAYEVQDPATTCPGGGAPPCTTGAATPELGSGELLATGLLPLGLALLVRRRRARRIAQQ
jgi:hypothetical protein